MRTAFYALLALALCPPATAATAASPPSPAINSTRDTGDLQPNATAISCTLPHPAAAIKIIAATLHQPPNAGATTPSLSTGPLMMYMDGALAPSTIVGIVFFSVLFIALQVALLCVWRKRRTNAAALPPPASSSSSSSAGRSSRGVIFAITLPMPSSASRLPQAQVAAALPSKEQDALESDTALGMDGYATELVPRPPGRAARGQW